MKKLVTALHILGVVLFFGSILGHAVTGLVPGLHENGQTYLVAREITDIATWYLTLPGLALVTLSGVWLVVTHERPLRDLRTHLMIVLLIIANALFILLPTGQAILTEAHDLVAATGSKEAISAYETREAIFGAINIMACLIAIYIGVLKPGSNKN